MIEIILITISLLVNAYLLYKYIPVWMAYRKALKLDKEIEAEIDVMGKDEELTAEQCDPKNWLPSPEELEKLLDEDEDDYVEGN